ncbi:MAG TPA: acyl-CoA dehydrogenase family protein [Alphaproteobacteria bacterium]|jgi:3-hydroxy-9,10-secoandrosta-1,3,5(10)-triene-9,17-dione monooxygenase
MNDIRPPAKAPPTAAELVDRARALAPVLRQRAVAAEQLGRLPDETVRDYEAAELCRIWIPKRYGGFELDLEAGLETCWEAAKGCASSAWCLSVWQQHSWIVAHFPEQAQAESLGADMNFHIGSVLSPRGKARKVAGGYVLSGRWPFASGCDHGWWIMLGATVVDDAGNEIPLDGTLYGRPKANARLCLLPMQDVVNLADWLTAGLAATGSHTIVVKDAFVPEHRTISIPDTVDGHAPGREIHEGALFRVPYYAFLVTSLASPAPGVAEGALEALVANAEKRVLAPMNLVQSKMVRTDRQIGEAAAKIHAARQLFYGNARRIMECGRAGPAMGVQERADCRNNVAFAVQLCYEAMETIFFAAGGSALALDNPIQRAMRDMHAVKAHYFMDIETTRELAGMIRLGKTPFTYIF